MATDDLANVEGEGILHLGNDRRCRAGRVEIGLASHEGDRLEVSAVPIVGPLLVGFCVGSTSDDKVQRVRPDVTPGPLCMSQQTTGVGSRRFEVVIANDELVVTVLSAEPHAPVRLAGTDNRHAARLWSWGQAAVTHGEELAFEVGLASRP
jgi:hypothetical protein